MKQLRGKELENRIEAVIIELSSNPGKAGKSYRYNATQVAAIVPTTRKTLAKHSALVNQILESIEADKRTANADSTVLKLKSQINTLKELLKVKDETILGLRLHHIEIYTRLRQNSIEGEILIRPILDKECTEFGKCNFCGNSIDVSKPLLKNSNVIPFEQKD